jgi:hypothetical protein
MIMMRMCDASNMQPKPRFSSLIMMRHRHHQPRLPSHPHCSLGKTNRHLGSLREVLANKTYANQHRMYRTAASSYADATYSYQHIAICTHTVHNSRTATYPGSPVPSHRAHAVSSSTTARVCLLPARATGRNSVAVYPPPNSTCDGQL